MSGKRGGRGGGGASKLSVSKELLKRSAAEAGLDDRHLKVLSDITRPPLFPDFYWHSAGKYWEQQAASVEDEGVGATDGGSSSFARKQRPHSIKSEASQPSPQPLQQIQRPASVIALMNKQRELFARMQNGPYGIRPTPVMDVVRYNRRRNNETASSSAQHSHHPDVRVLASLTCATTTTTSSSSNSSALGTSTMMMRPLGSDVRYFPAELLGQSPVPPKSPLPRKFAQSSAQTSANTKSTPLDELAWRESKRLRATSVGDKDESGGGGGGGDQDEDDELALNLPEEEEEGEDYTTNYYNTDDEEDHKDGGGGADGEEEPTF
jgi:hypothetical protein